MHVVNHNPEGCLELEARVQMGILLIFFALCLKATVEGRSAEVILSPT